MSSAKDLAVIPPNGRLPLGMTKEFTEAPFSSSGSSFLGAVTALIPAWMVGVGYAFITSANGMSNMEILSHFGVIVSSGLGLGGSIGFVSGRRTSMKDAIQKFQPLNFYKNYDVVNKTSWNHVLPFKESYSKITLINNEGKPQEILLITKGEKARIEYLIQGDPGIAWDGMMNTVKTAYNITPKPKIPESIENTPLSLESPKPATALFSKITDRWNRTLSKKEFISG